jgi:hypothetical protein
VLQVDCRRLDMRAAHGDAALRRVLGAVVGEGTAAWLAASSKAAVCDETADAGTLARLIHLTLVSVAAEMDALGGPVS